jgi:guanine nucleotide-binding protein subunit alpha
MYLLSFLNDLERVTSLKYMPSEGKVFCIIPIVLPVSRIKFWKDDVLKARLKTVGVSEYKFEMEVTAGRDSGTEWRIVDVGGSRSQVWRLAWCYYFVNSSTLIAT